MIKRLKKFLKLDSNQIEAKPDHVVVAALRAVREMSTRPTALAGAPLAHSAAAENPSEPLSTVHAIGNSEFDLILTGRSNRKIVVTRNQKIVNFSGPWGKC
jgi:hypothetical protein